MKKLLFIEVKGRETNKFVVFFDAVHFPLNFKDVTLQNSVRISDGEFNTLRQTHFLSR